MRPISFILLMGLLLCGCSTFTNIVKNTPDPRVLAVQPSMNTIPLAPMEEGIYCMPGSGLNRIIMLFPGGTLLDPHGKEGALQLLCSNMISGGTKDYTPFQLQDVLGDLAVSISINPQREYTMVSMTFLPDVTQKAISLLRDMLTNPRLDSARLEIERKVYIDSVVREREDAMNVAFDTYREHYYQGEPRAFRPVPDTILSVTRDDLLNLHHIVFTKKPLIGVIGPIEKNFTKDLLGPFSGTWKAKPLGYPKKPGYGNFNATATEKQCVLVKAHAAPSMLDRDYAASVVADHLIGSGGFSSLMVKEVRTRKGLAYSTNSFYQARPRWGVFGMCVITESKDLPEVRVALQRVAEEIRHGFKPEDVAWAKQSVMNSYAVGYNTPAKIISHTMDMIFYDIPMDFDAGFLAQVNSLTPSDVQAAALKLIESPWVEVVVNPPIEQNASRK